jgi:formate hydrogenlyase subunit 3/multisubunit Na+/H+ antiporter MnhD subunit
MAAGLMAGVLGHDRIADLRGIGRALPVTVFAFGLAALSLVGVPPSGGFFTKCLLLSASNDAGQWWWAMVILAGGLLAGGYMFRALVPALADSETPLTLTAPVSRLREIVVLALALCALLVGMFPQKPVELLKIGRAHPPEVTPP